MHTKLLTILEREIQRQKYTLDLIPSENFTSKSVRKAVGSVFMHKYAEGYPEARYYEGNEFVDELESLCIKMILKVFGLDELEWHANVQPLSGSIANLAVYNSILKPGDKILSMYLPDGGHLSHGWSYDAIKDKKNSSKKIKSQNEEMIYTGGKRKVSVVSKLYNVIQYKTDPKSNLFDYNFIEKLAQKEKPQLIITGGTAYPRDLDYKRMSEIASTVGAYYLADVAHEAGLIAGGAVNSPFNYADFVTFTTHKTLRGPRGAVIVCKKKYAEKIDKSVFPGMQGGPFQHTIAGLTQALFEADTEDFKQYAKQVVLNAKILASELMNMGFDVITGGTDKHLLLINMTGKGLSGKQISRALAYAGIISNKNTVPYEKNSPVNPSGLRIGTPTVTTRGMKEEQMRFIAEIINEVTEFAKKHADLSFEDFNKKMFDAYELREVRLRVEKLCEEFMVE